MLATGTTDLAFPRQAIGRTVVQMLRSTQAAVRLHSTRVLGCCASWLLRVGAFRGCP